MLGFPGAVMLLTCTLTTKSFQVKFNGIYKLSVGVVKDTYVTRMLLQCCTYYSGKAAVMTTILSRLLGQVCPMLHATANRLIRCVRRKASQAAVAMWLQPAWHKAYISVWVRHAASPPPSPNPLPAELQLVLHVVC